MNDAPFDLLISGGTVIDGTRGPRFDADLGLRGGHIAAVGDLSGHAARHCLDASGLIVAPGFIDVHTHDDAALISDRGMDFKLSQGVTTVIAGNCGISMAPLPPRGELPAPMNLLAIDAAPRFASLAGYFACLEAAPPAVNVAMLVGHTSLRTCTMARQGAGDEVADRPGGLRFTRIAAT